MTETESEFLYHEPCPECHSSDAGSRYSDGHFFCHSCHHYIKGDDDERSHTGGGDVLANAVHQRPRMSDLLSGEIRALIKRGITEETCKKFGYLVADTSKGRVQVASYRDQDGTITAQHCRTADKDFFWIGPAKGVQMYGQHLWGSGKMIVVTEGEIDCMTVCQQQGLKWPVVSLPSGASGAVKAISANLKFFDQFDTIVLMFDMDDPGQEAAQAAAPLFPTGKVKIATLSMKDPNELLLAGKGAEIIDAIWRAKPWRPEGSMKLSELKESMKEEIMAGLPWCFEKLTEMTHGRRYGEIYTLGAGTGVGKTDFLTQQVAFDLMELKEKVSVIFLEQQPKETGLRIAGKNAGKRLHIPGAGWTNAQRDQAIDVLCDGDLLDLYDHFGCAEWPRIEAHIRYLNKAEGYRIFYIDHLTALADTGDAERGSLEEIMGAMGKLVKALDCMIILVSHLTTPDGKPHEEGGRVTVRQFKGSRAIGFWSHYMFGLERDQQAEDLAERQSTTFRVLKDRYTGQATGQTFHLGYDADTGRLFEQEAPGEECPF